MALPDDVWSGRLTPLAGFAAGLEDLLARLAREQVAVHVPAGPVARIDRGMHLHPHPEIFLQLSGFTRFECPGESFRLRPGELCLMPRGMPHREQAGPWQGQPFLNLVIMFHARRIGCHLARAAGDRPGVWRLVELPAVSPAGLSSYIRDLLAARDGTPLGQAVQRGLLTALFARLLQLAAGQAQAFDEPAKVRHAKQFVAANLDSFDLNVNSVAAWLECAPDYLSHLFRRTTGVRLAAYINRLRLERASELLATTGMSVAEVAWACGYQDPGYMGRMLRAQTGMSPGRYRRSYGA